MLKIFCISVLLLFFSPVLLVSQVNERRIPDYNYEISNSSGLNFDNAKPVFYLNILRKSNDKFSVGLKGGVYTYIEKIETKLHDDYLPVYKTLRPGYYYMQYNDLMVNGITYIAAITVKYKITGAFSAGFSAGAKNYKSTGYFAGFYFAKAGDNYSFDVSISKLRENGKSKNITKAYYALNVDYKLGRFTLGLYGDNIYSFGYTLGILF
jgi:hypothetical protein